MVPFGYGNPYCHFSHQPCRILGHRSVYHPGLRSPADRRLARGVDQHPGCERDCHQEYAHQQRERGDVDVQPGGRHGTRAVTLYFDGIDDQLNMGNVLMLTDSDFTVETWLSTTQTTDGYIIGKHEPGWVNGYFLVINGEYGGIPYANKVWFYTADAPGEVAVSTTDINDGQWHHIAGVYHVSGNKELFVDGILEASIPAGTHLPPMMLPSGWDSWQRVGRPTSRGKSMRLASGMSHTPRSKSKVQ